MVQRPPETKNQRAAAQATGDGSQRQHSQRPTETKDQRAAAHHHCSAAARRAAFGVPSKARQTPRACPAASDGESSSQRL